MNMKSGLTKFIKLILPLGVVVLTALNVFAQQNEVGFLLGANDAQGSDFAPPSIGSIDPGNGLTYVVTYGRRFTDAKLASMHFEMLFAATPNTDINSSNVLLPRSYSSIFLTPGLKLKFLPGYFISPYVAAGAGYARFNVSDTTISGTTTTVTSRGSNKGVYNYGIGAEFKIFPGLSLRGEIRNFQAGTPNFGIDILQDTRRYVIYAGGLVVRF
ncbi:MAG: outer membrane beta-barrel protein [Blastocatellia bacterium]|nr:outer membrane beta-barrel protein [Blastocatellia bacterium]